MLNEAHGGQAWKARGADSERLGAPGHSREEAFVAANWKRSSFYFPFKAEDQVWRASVRKMEIARGLDCFRFGLESHSQKRPSSNKKDFDSVRA